MFLKFYYLLNFNPIQVGVHQKDINSHEISLTVEEKNINKKKMNYYLYFFFIIREMTTIFIHNLHLTLQLDTLLPKRPTPNEHLLSQEQQHYQNQENINQNNINHHNIYVNEHFSDLNHCDYFYYMDPSEKEEEDFL